MRRRQSARIVLVLVIISIVLLGLSRAGILAPPIAGADRFAKATKKPSIDFSDKNSEEEDNPSSNLSQSSANTSANSEEGVESSETSTDVLKPIIVRPNDPDALPDSENQSLRLWPKESAIAEIHDADIEYYRSLQDDPHPLQGVTVILDPSHGGSSSGATYTKDNKLFTEKDIVLNIAQYAEKVLTDMGAKVLMTRTGDIEHSLFYVTALTADIVLKDFMQIADDNKYDSTIVHDLRLQMDDVMRINQNNPASGGRGLFGSIGTPSRLRLIYDIQAQYQNVIFINISLNESNEEDKQGAEIFLMDADFVKDVNNSYVGEKDVNDLAPNYTMIDSDSRHRLAFLLYGHLQKQLPKLANSDLANTINKDMAVLRLNNLTSAAIAPGYLSNESDREILLSSDGQEKIGVSIAYAVRQFYVGP